MLTSLRRSVPSSRGASSRRGRLALAAALATISGVQAAQASINWNFQVARIEIASEAANSGGEFTSWTFDTANTPPTTIVAEGLPNGRKFYGNGPGLTTSDPSDVAARLTGAQLDFLAANNDGHRGFRLTIRGTYTVTGPLDPLAFFQVLGDYDYAFSGGQLRDAGAGAGFSVRNAQGNALSNGLAGVGIGFGPSLAYTDGPESFSTGFVFNFDNQFAFGNLPGLASGEFEVNLAFEWINYAPNDIFQISIPQGSIEVLFVPGPGAAAALGLGGLMAARRRR